MEQEKLKEILGILNKYSGLVEHFSTIHTSDGGTELRLNLEYSWNYHEAELDECFERMRNLCETEVVKCQGTINDFHLKSIRDRLTCVDHKLNNLNCHLERIDDAALINKPNFGRSLRGSKNAISDAKEDLDIVRNEVGSLINGNI